MAGNGFAAFLETFDADGRRRGARQVAGAIATARIWLAGTSAAEPPDGYYARVETTSAYHKPVSRV